MTAGGAAQASGEGSGKGYHAAGKKRKTKKGDERPRQPLPVAT